MENIGMNLSKKISFALLLNFFISTTAMAVLSDEIQVYDGEINEPGEFGLELHFNTSPMGIKDPSFPNERVSNGGSRLTPEFSYGLTKTVELGFYLPTIYTPTYGYELAGYKTRIKWMPIQQSESQPWALGINAEYSRLAYGMEDSRDHLEYRFIVSHQTENWKVAVNPILGVNVSPGFDRTPEFDLNAQLMKRFNGEIKGIGLEFYQSFGPYNNFNPYNQQGKQIFAVVDLSPNHGFLKDWGFHLGIGTGWDGADPLVFKMILTPKF